jgi:hypothetical protein
VYRHLIRPHHLAALLRGLDHSKVASAVAIPQRPEW